MVDGLSKNEIVLVTFKSLDVIRVKTVAALGGIFVESLATLSLLSALVFPVPADTKAIR